MGTSQYAFYFDEGAGYLFVKNIGNPSTGEVQLVRCCVDGKLYVRKRLDPCPNRTLDANSNPISSMEVLFYRPHEYIPILIDWNNNLPVEYPIRMVVENLHLGSTAAAAI